MTKIYLAISFILLSVLFTGCIKQPQYVYHGEMKDGKFTGEKETYYEQDGKKVLTAKRTYKNGVLDGTMKFYYKNGNMSALTNTKNGQIVNITNFDKKQIKRAYQVYENDKLSSITRYSLDGKKTDMREFAPAGSFNKIIHTYFDKEEVKSSESQYINLYNVSIIDFYKSGKIKSITLDKPGYKPVKKNFDEDGNDIGLSALDSMVYANSISESKKENVYFDTPLKDPKWEDWIKYEINYKY